MSYVFQAMHLLKSCELQTHVVLIKKQCLLSQWDRDSKRKREGGGGGRQRGGVIKLNAAPWSDTFNPVLQEKKWDSTWDSDSAKAVMIISDVWEDGREKKDMNHTVDCGLHGHQLNTCGSKTALHTTFKTPDERKIFWKFIPRAGLSKNCTATPLHVVFFFLTHVDLCEFVL